MGREKERKRERERERDMRRKEIKVTKGDAIHICRLNTNTVLSVSVHSK